MPDWTFLIAFSFFRIIAIAQGVYKRSLDGNASNPELARQVGEFVPMMAHIAWEGVEAGRRHVDARGASAAVCPGSDRYGIDCVDSGVP